MRHASILLVMLTIVSLAFTGCESKLDAPPATQHPPAAAATVSAPASANGPTHAPRGVQPGSHEDWCGEHQVPESLCTRCNPSLTVAFKATGDWCAEHGLPESQCLICNPDLKIERPPQATEDVP